MTANSSTPVQPPQGRTAIEEKVNGLYTSAKLAFAENDFGGAVRFLEQIPESYHDREMNGLLKQCQQRHLAQTQLDIAKRFLENREFGHAIRALERVPSNVRSEEIARMLKNSKLQEKVQPTLDAAKRQLEVFDFDEVVRIISEVDEEVRTDELITILQHACTKNIELQELREQLKEELAHAQSEDAVGHFIACLPILREILRIKPNDIEAGALLERLQKYEEYLETRDSAITEGRAAFEAKDFETTVRLMATIPEEVRNETTAELLEQSEKSIRLRDAIFTEILSALRAQQFAVVPERMTELEQLATKPIETLLASLGADGTRKCLIGMGRCGGDDDAVLTLLDQLIDALTPLEFREFVRSAGAEFFETYPARGAAIPARLAHVVATLHTDVGGVPDMLEVMTVAESRLHEDDVICVDLWKRCLNLIDQFDQISCCSHRWRESIIESPASRQLEAISEDLASVAERILPPEYDRWELLKKLAQGRLDGGPRLVRRAYKKMSHYLKTNYWSKKPLIPVTMRRAGQALAWSICLMIVAAVAQTVISLVFKVGGFTSYLAVAILFVLWTVFYVVANKIMTSSSS